MRRSKRGKALIGPQGNKCSYKNIDFDSEDEMRYYMLLERNPAVKSIEPHPQYQIIAPYETECHKCGGNGQIQNVKTKNMNKCPRCKFGRVTKPGAVYTADFKVLYIDGFEEVIDVKGGLVNRDFSLRRKLFEQQTGKELTVIAWDNKTKSWKRKK